MKKKQKKKPYNVHVILLHESEVNEETLMAIILPKSYLNLHTFIHSYALLKSSNGLPSIRNKIYNLSTSERGQNLVRYNRVKS